MLQKTFQFLKETLNQFLKNRFGVDEQIVINNHLVDATGAIPSKNQNKVVISLINIEEERNQPFHIRNRQLADGQYTNFQPNQRFNLDILISTQFDEYDESLKFLNAVLLFFQINPVITSSSFSNLPAGISKLEFELENINYRELHSLWTAMGAKYQPSVIFRIRLLTLQGDEIDAILPEITDTQTSANPL